MTVHDALFERVKRANPAPPSQPVGTITLRRLVDDRLEMRRRIVRGPMIAVAAAVALFAVVIPLVLLNDDPARLGSDDSSPPKAAPSLSAVMTVSELAWANSPGDEVDFTIAVTNTGEANFVAVVAVDEYSAEITLEAGERWTDDGTVDDYRHTVTAEDLEAPTLIRTVRVTSGETTRTYTATATVQAVGPCDLQQGAEGLVGYLSGVCSWAPPQTGYWSFAVTPERSTDTPIEVTATARDGVPGNWCVAPLDPDDLEAGFIEASGGVLATWSTGDPPITLNVYLPDNGTCLQGGAEGNPIVVRNTDLLYLWVSEPAEIVATPCVVENVTLGCRP
ncbi:MAG: hypothetical protein OEO77_11205 [Acidimicrobiia bacterium]|nr:hypothetical protein [Acidimicrobiia bacterium]